MGASTQTGAASRAPDNQNAQRIIRRYDAAYKQILARKPLLAYIMKNTLAEYRDCSLEEIVAAIDGSVETGTRTVDPMRVRTPLSSGLPTEDTSVDEGDIRYDVLFRAQLPNRDGDIGIVVNIEAQTKYNPGYPLLKRAVYYCARLLSAQRGTGRAGSDYRKLEKVCSVWLCIDVPQDTMGSVTEYALSENHICGAAAKREIETYDLLSIVIVCLPRHGGYNGFIETMATVFSLDTERSRRLDALRRALGPSLACEFEGGSNGMGDSPGLYIYECGMEDGGKETTCISLERLMKNTSFDLEQAMQVLEVPEEERPRYREVFASPPQERHFDKMFRRKFADRLL